MQQELFSTIVKRYPRRMESKRLWTHAFKDVAIWLMLVGAMQSGELFGHVLAGILFAIFTFRSFGIMHDCVHNSAHSQRRRNEQLGELYGIFCFLPFGSWRDLHLAHHMWTGNVEKDPSMKILLKFEQNQFRTPKLVAMSWRYWIPLLGFMQHLVFWAPALKRKNYVFSVGVMLYLATALWVMGPWVLVGGMLAYLYMVEVINFPHHLDLVQHKGEHRFPVYEQNQFARTCVYPRWIAHNILLNFNLHTEHHLLPSYPWYQLDEIHQELVAQGQLLNASSGNAWILRHRQRPVEEVFAGTFPAPSEAEKKVA